MSFTLSAWFNKWYNVYNDQSIDSSHKLVCWGIFLMQLHPFCYPHYSWPSESWYTSQSKNKKNKQTNKLVSCSNRNCWKNYSCVETINTVCLLDFALSFDISSEKIKQEWPIFQDRTVQIPQSGTLCFTLGVFFFVCLLVFFVLVFFFLFLFVFVFVFLFLVFVFLCCMQWLNQRRYPTHSNSV